MNLSRNEPCPCGSGLKYKRCCGKISDEPAPIPPRIPSPLPAEIEQLTALFHARRYADLESQSRALMERHPDSGYVWKLFGLALGVQGKDALYALQQAAALLPNDADALNNLGNAQQDSGQLDGAVDSYRRALAIRPDFASAHYNLGISLQALDRLDEAAASYRRALELQPDLADAHGDYAYLLLSLGDFERGWLEYEWRLTGTVCRGCPVDPRTQSPLPKASALSPFTSHDKRILLFHEQGIGDELFFLRFAAQLREKVQWVGYLPSGKVRSLIERSGCVDQVLSSPEANAPADSVIRVGDLPLLLGCHSAGDIPKPLRLVPADRHSASVRQRLLEGGLAGLPLLGVTWRAGLEPVSGAAKTLFKQIELDALADAIKDWKGAIAVLQRNPAAGEIEQLRGQLLCPVHDFSHYNDDLESMLALLDALDEYVGVSNANMHLMAGLRRTARVLIPAPGEWRWMARGEQSPWFPGFSLYRQTFAGDWAPTLDALKRDLAKSRRPPPERIGKLDG